MKKILALALGMALMTSVAYAEKVKLSILAMVEPGTVGEEAFNQTVEQFQAAFPDIELELERVSHDPFHSKLQAMAVGKQLPDAFFLWPGKRTGYVTAAGLAKDLRPWLKGKEDQFLTGMLAPQGPNGEIFELPMQVTSTHVMFANDRMLKELGLTFPKTLAELVEQSKKIREAGFVPLAMGNSEGWPMQSCFLSTLTDRAGGQEWFDKAIKGDGASFADPQFISALNVLKTLVDEKVFVDGMNQMDRTQAVELFAQEKAVYYIEGDWRVTDFQKTLTDEQKAYISLNVFPEIPDQKGVANSTAAVPGTGYGMNAALEGAKADAAWEWIWFIAGQTGSKIRLEVQGVVPAYKDVKAPDTLDALVKKLIAFTAEHPMTYVIDDKMDAEGVGNVLNPGLQELTMGAKSPEDVAKEYEAWVVANDSNRKK